MFNALGVGGGGSLIGGVAVLLAPIPFIFYKYGRPIRERSRFAPTKPKQPDVEKQVEEAAPQRRSSDGNSSDRYEMALDEEAGVPDQGEVEKDIEKERELSPTSSSEKDDRFLDASGIEKAEHIPA